MTNTNQMEVSMWYLISFLGGFVLGAVAVIAVALLWPDDDDDDDYWDYSAIGRYYSGDRYGQRYNPY